MTKVMSSVDKKTQTHNNNIHIMKETSQATKKWEEFFILSSLSTNDTTRGESRTFSTNTRGILQYFFFRISMRGSAPLVVVASSGGGGQTK